MAWVGRIYKCHERDVEYVDVDDTKGDEFSVRDLMLTCTSVDIVISTKSGFGICVYQSRRLQRR